MKAPREVVRDYFHRLLNEKDISVCDEVLAEDYVDHDAPESAPPGPAGTKQFVSDFVCEYPDLRIEVKDMLCEGRKVAARLEWIGTHRASGAPYRRMGIVILHLNARGQITERWSAYL
jgi:ketosteroid isomerase-like protein